MDRRDGARECRGSGHRLRGARGDYRLCAGLPRSTGLRGPAALSSAGGLSGAAGARPTSCSCRSRSPDSRLVGTASSPGSPAGTAATATATPADSCRGPCAPSSASRRGHSGRSESLLRLDTGLLGLERSLDMGWRPLGSPAQAHCRLGGRSLVAARPRLCVDRRRLALISNP